MPMRPAICCNYPGCLGGTALPGTSYCAKHQKSAQEADRLRDAKRYRDNPYRAWYDLPIWKDHLRPAVKNRDPLCKICGREGSEIVDHIVDHMGNWELFVDMNNLQGVCESCHNAKKKPYRGVAPKQHAAECMIRRGLGVCTCGVGAMVPY